MLPETAAPLEPEATSGSEPARTEPDRSVWWSIGAICLVLALGIGVAVVLATRSGDDSASTPAASELTRVTYLVPRGTGDRIDAGEEVVIIPKVLHLIVGTTLVIVNDDTREHTVGGYTVRAGDSLEITYPRQGLYMNACSTNTDKLVYIYVDPPTDA